MALPLPPPQAQPLWALLSLQVLAEPVGTSACAQVNCRAHANTEKVLDFPSSSLHMHGKPHTPPYMCIWLGNPAHAQMSWRAILEPEPCSTKKTEQASPTCSLRWRFGFKPKHCHMGEFTCFLISGGLTALVVQSGENDFVSITAWGEKGYPKALVLSNQEC